MALTEHQKAALWGIHTGTHFAPGSKAHAFADAIEAAATAPLLERIAALTAQVEQAAQPVADPFTYVIQHLNSNPYALSKDECIEKIKELRPLYTAPPKAVPLTDEQAASMAIYFNVPADYVRMVYNQSHGITPATAEKG